MKEFSSRQWNKTTLSYFWSIWKNSALLLESARVAT